ncbi:MAG TPA: hypothetical protein DCF45_07640 [Gammaproteobacteria bacterium]|nr:hypothetical protein [Gammaproteobacteria bacterium]
MQQQQGGLISRSCFMVKGLKSTRGDCALTDFHSALQITDTSWGSNLQFEERNHIGIAPWKQQG